MNTQFTLSYSNKKTYIQREIHGTLCYVMFDIMHLCGRYALASSGYNFDLMGVHKVLNSTRTRLAPFSVHKCIKSIKNEENQWEKLVNT